jgi:hypothetical protein
MNLDFFPFSVENPVFSPKIRFQMSENTQKCFQYVPNTFKTRFNTFKHPTNYGCLFSITSRLTSEEVAIESSARSS